MFKLMGMIAAILTYSAIANESNPKENSIEKKVTTQNEKFKDEVVENPSLKTLSGALRRWSMYSAFKYSGGSLSEPTSAERPNIQNTKGKPGLVSMTGNIGVKLRMTKQDNISLQTGLYSTTPFHSKIETDNAANKADHEKNGQNIDIDDPTISYFRTYNIGKLQNVSFLTYQYVTQGSYRDLGYRSAARISHSAAYRLLPFLYVAGTVSYENRQFDKDTVLYRGLIELPLYGYQEQHVWRGNLAAEMYISRKIAFRFITDIFSRYELRKQSKSEKKVNQQTIAMTYFINRDISIAPNIRFIADDLRADRTNVGFSLNLNL